MNEFFSFIASGAGRLLRVVTGFALDGVVYGRMVIFVPMADTPTSTARARRLANLHEIQAFKTPVRLLERSNSMTNIDPVCGMTVEHDKAAGSFEYEGQQYYFCSTSCLQKFSAAPKSYLSPATASATPDTNSGESSDSYTPLIVIILLITASAVALGIKDSLQAGFSLRNAISYFMTGFFLVFAGFKLVDIKGFAEGYSTYDLLAMRWYGYGYVYPFIELGFGLAMLVGYETRALFIAEFIVMAFSGFGVAIKIAKKERFQCACLGTFLKVPLTKVTLVEDFGMAALALAMLLIL